MLPEFPRSPYKSVGGLGRLIRACRYSLQGLAAALRHEAAFRQETALALILVPLAIWIGRTTLEAMVLLGVVVLLLVVELLNSAVEAVADAVTVDHHPLLGRAKDLGSAAVMLTLLFAGGVWACVLIERFVLQS
ncbi:MAG: diacylglycerol kinase [Burkholderiales bacterium]|nr:diacylglycerol kinase [Burkholderiales bacterium]